MGVVDREGGEEGRGGAEGEARGGWGGEDGGGWKVDDLLILYSHVISNIPPVFLLSHDRGPRLRAEMYANIFNSRYRPSERQSMYMYGTLGKSAVWAFLMYKYCSFRRSVDRILFKMLKD